MPSYRRDGASNWLLNMLRYPPVILLLEVADCNDASAGSDGELRLRRRPAYESGCAIYTEKNEGWFVACWGRLPDKSIAV